jgi:hypothetical protein
VRGEEDVKAVGSGLIGFMINQDVSVLHGTPFASVLPLGSDKADRHASGKLEAWLNTGIWLSTNGAKVWDTVNLDLRMVGRAWSKVLPAPQFWAGDELKELVDRLNVLVAEGGEIDEQKEKIREYKRDNWPIVWRSVSFRDTWPTRDEKGLAEVVERAKMSRAEIEGRGFKLETQDKEIEVIHWANTTHVATVIAGSGGVGIGSFRVGKKESQYLQEPWEHGLGVNPYVLIEGDPVPDNDFGIHWISATYQMTGMVEAVDEVLSDFRTSYHRSTVAPYFVKTNLAGRAADGIEEKVIEVKENKTVQMYTGEGWTEDAGVFPVPTVTPDALRFVGLALDFADRGGLSRPILTGAVQSGQSAVSQETSRQIATGELKVAHESLQQGFADVGERHFRSVISLGRDSPTTLKEITVREEDAEHGSKEITVSDEDVREYLRLIRGVIALNIPIDEGQAVLHAKMSTDPSHPLLTDNSARQRYYRHEDPVGEGDKLAEQALVQGSVSILLATLQRRLLGSIEEMGDVPALIEKAGSLPEAATAALEASFEGNVPPELANLFRGQANKARIGRQQGMSSLSGMGQRLP